MTKILRPQIYITLFIMAIIPQAISYKDRLQYKPKATDFVPDEDPQGRVLPSYSNIRIVFDSTGILC